MRPTIDQKRQAFRDLHESGCFIIPNPWDAGSAAILQKLGFKAIASSSAGFAWTTARADYNVTRDGVLSHLKALVDATDIPVNADFENGFAHAPEEVATNVKLAVDTGLAGLSIEDSTWIEGDPLYAFDDAVARIAAARQAIDETGSGVLLTARSEGFFAGKPDLDETVARIKAYANAGADCLYAPGLRDKEQIAAVIAAAGGKPVNVLSYGMSLQELDAMGVRRISVGGSLTRSVYAELIRIATEIAKTGEISAIQTPQSAGINLNEIMETYRDG
ncbi:MAG: isocitrate lyase/PEP mutase family protein [Alphaproteobacteria bacterium]